MHAAGIGEVLDIVPGLHVGAGLGARPQRLDETGGEGLRDLREGQDGRLHAQQLAHLLRLAGVDADRLALEILERGHRLGGVEALAGPWRVGQYPHAVAGEDLVEIGLLRLHQLPGVVIVLDQVRQVVEVVDRVLVAIDGKADLTDLDLAGLDRALDGVVLDEGVVRPEVDGELALSLLLDLVDELANVDGEIAVVGISGRHHPLGLRHGGCRGADRRDACSKTQ